MNKIRDEFYDWFDKQDFKTKNLVNDYLYYRDGQTIAFDNLEGGGGTGVITDSFYLEHGKSDLVKKNIYKKRLKNIKTLLD